MADIMMALAKRKQRLVARRRAAFDEFKKESDAIDAELKEVELAIKKVEEAIHRTISARYAKEPGKSVYVMRRDRWKVFVVLLVTEPESNCRRNTE